LQGFFIGSYCEASYSIELERQWIASAHEIFNKMTTVIDKDAQIIEKSEEIRTGITETYDCVLKYNYGCAQNKINRVTRLEGQQDILYQETNQLIKEIGQMLEKQEELEVNELLI